MRQGELLTMAGNCDEPGDENRDVGTVKMARTLKSFLPKTGGRKKKPESPHLAIEYRPLDWFRPYERNPRNNDKAVDRMRASIREFGFSIPMLARSAIREGWF